MSYHTFADVEAALTAHIPPARSMRANYKLDTMRALMKHLGNPQDSYKVIHIAGTSGKTSTAYFAASLLLQTGKKIGLTVSPHVSVLSERVQINLQPLDEAEYCAAFSEYMQLVKDGGFQPTYFELLVAFAYWYFAQAQVDYAVIEVGLGGLLDGTNVINRADKVSVLTDIGLDHIDVLGDNIQDIAYQKAGIVLPGSSAFCLEQSAEVISVFREQANKRSAELTVITQDAHSEAQNLPLYQQRNWSLAHAVVQYVCQRDGMTQLTEEQLHKSTTVYIPARMEVLQDDGTTVILDAAHNPQKMEALVKSLKQAYPNQKFTVLLALLRSRDARVQGVLEQLLPITDELIITDFVAGQDLRKYATVPEQIVTVCNQQGFTNVSIEPDNKKAFEVLMQSGAKHKLITGSFYLLHDLRESLAPLRSKTH